MLKISQFSGHVLEMLQTRVTRHFELFLLRGTKYHTSGTCLNPLIYYLPF